MLGRHVLFLHGFKDLKTIFSSVFAALFAYFWLFGPFTMKIIVFSVQKISLPIRASEKTKMYLPESPFHKNSLCRVSGLVFMLVPVRT